MRKCFLMSARHAHEVTQSDNTVVHKDTRVGKEHDTLEYPH